MARAKVLLAILLVLTVAILPGCIEDDDKDPDDDGPLVGTTQGFRMPDFEMATHEGSSLTLRNISADLIMVHVVSDTEEPYLPQFVQIKAVREEITNITVEAVTLLPGGRYDDTMMTDLRQEVGGDWTFAIVADGVLDTLSLQKYPTVFILDEDQVILERSDEALGQGRIIQAIESTWGVEPPENVAPQVGSTVPDLVWRDVNGTEGRLSDLQGSPVILNVWEMECPFCLQLFVELEKVYANHSGQGLRMVSIDIITWETEDQVRSVMETYNATWTFAIDGDNIQSRYDIWRLPLLVLLDGDGVVRWTWTGYTHHSVIDDEVEKLI